MWWVSIFSVVRKWFCCVLEKFMVRISGVVICDRYLWKFVLFCLVMWCRCVVGMVVWVEVDRELKFLIIVCGISLCVKVVVVLLFVVMILCIKGCIRFRLVCLNGLLLISSIGLGLVRMVICFCWCCERCGERVVFIGCLVWYRLEVW